MVKCKKCKMGKDVDMAYDGKVKDNTSLNDGKDVYFCKYCGRRELL